MRLNTLALFALCSMLLGQQAPRLHSRLCVFNLDGHTTRTVYRDDAVIEAPNWSPDGKYLLFNRGGNLYRISVDGGQPEQIPLGGMARCNNDKGYSPDGKLIAFSSSAQANGSQIFTVPSSGGTPQRVVPEVPSYFHAFSPDGQFLAFVSQRSGHFHLYRVPVTRGDQQQLTTAPSYDDGPDYSPDGKWIYFNSDRSGSWAVWRMPADGAGPEDSRAQRVTFDDVEDWFPHCSPDGKWLVYVTFPKGTKTHNDRMPGVQLWIMPLPGGNITRTKAELLTTFFGGQGTINVNSWAPNAKQFAFVTFEP